MFDVVLPEFQTLITMIGTGFGFIIVISAIGETVFHGFIEALRNIRWTI
jgi:hypothetical protein